MAKTMDFNAVKGSNWYKKGNFDTACPELGIREVRFTAPNGSHERVIANAIIELDNSITLFGTIYLARNGEDLTFGVQQREYTQDGVKRYVDINVRIPLKVQAHVLNLAEGRMLEGPAQPVQSANPAPQASQPAQDTQPAPQAQASDAPQKDVSEMSRDELLAFVAKG